MPATSAADEPTKTRFATALGELVLLEAVPWAIDRYIADESFARISIHTVEENFKTGFTYDRDAFKVNQAQHPYHGGLFFNAARSNGFGFWESAAFTLAGSFAWECGMENTLPAINDLVNTTLGGIAVGEITRRLAVMIRDNTKHGFNRFLRELSGTIVDPVGGFNRLTHGDMTAESPNPDERFPSSFHASADLGYRHVGGGAEKPNQSTLSFSAVYGDPFAGEIQKPYQFFAVEGDVNFPGEAVSRVEGRGILKGWELSEPTDRARHIIGVYQEYEYFSNEAQVFGAQTFSATLLSRFTLGKDFTATTDAGFIVFPLAGVQTTDFENPETGRNYDYGPGAGFRLSARLDVGGVGAAVSYFAGRSFTADGTSDASTLQFLNVGARVPLFLKLGLGAGYSWYSRKTTYPRFFEAQKTQSEWRVYLSWRL